MFIIYNLVGIFIFIMRGTNRTPAPEIINMVFVLVIVIMESLLI